MADPTDSIPVRCRQTGFRASIPAGDWDAYTDAQRDAYERLDGATAAAPAARVRKPGTESR